MNSILSIDFDYFIDISADDRERLFSDGSGEIPKDELSSMWNKCYGEHPEIAAIDVIDDFFYAKQFISHLSFKRESIFISNNHKDIKYLIDRIPIEEELKIVNIDFHHDYYHYYSSDSYYNCGNWLRRLVEDRKNVCVKWIRREDSQINSLEGEFPFENTIHIKELEGENFHYLFICKSPEWTPPHLNNRFEELTTLDTTDI